MVTVHRIAADTIGDERATRWSFFSRQTSSRRVAAAGLTSVTRRGGGIDAAKSGSVGCARLNMDGDRSNIVHRHVTEPSHSWH